MGCGSSKVSYSNNEFVENIFNDNEDELQAGKNCKKAPQFMQILEQHLINPPFSALGYIEFEGVYANCNTPEDAKKNYYKSTGTFYLTKVNNELIGITAAQNIYNRFNYKVINYESTASEKHNYHHNFKICFPKFPNSDSINFNIDLENIVVNEDYKKDSRDGNDFGLIFFTETQKEELKYNGFLNIKHQKNIYKEEELRLAGYFEDKIINLPLALRVQTSERRKFQLMNCKTNINKKVIFYSEVNEKKQVIASYLEGKPGVSGGCVLNESNKAIGIHFAKQQALFFNDLLYKEIEEMVKSKLEKKGATGGSNKGEIKDIIDIDLIVIDDRKPTEEIVDDKKLRGVFKKMSNLNTNDDVSKKLNDDFDFKYKEESKNFPLFHGVRPTKF